MRERNLGFTKIMLRVLPLMLLLLASFISPWASLSSALIFTLFLPGYIIVEYFFRELRFHEKLLLYILLSVLISTQLIYYLSLAFGYSWHTIYMAFLVFFVFFFLFLLYLPQHEASRKSLSITSLHAVLLSLGIALFTYFVLSQSVWVWQHDFIVLTGSNWQDTPLHYEIIESINNGNFPPQMPHFAGALMSYHYFVDFHTAILEKAFGSFFPRLIVFTNALFVFLFALSLYTLGSYVKTGRAGVYTTLLGTLGAGFSFLLFFSALCSGQYALTTNYTFEYGKFFTIPLIFDNLLQQRPQLLGLPTLTASVYFFYKGSRSCLSRSSNTGKREIALSGVLAGLLFPFHILACFSALFLCALNFTKKLVTMRFKSTENDELYFLPLFLLCVLPFLVQMMAGNEFSAGFFELKLPWAFYFVRDGPLEFYLANLGLPFILALSSLFKKSLHSHGFFVASWMFSMLAFPNLISFTPNVWDMYKFFHYAWIAIALAAGCFLADLTVPPVRKPSRKLKVFIPTAIVLLLVFSMFSSGLLAVWNLSTSYSCADRGGYETGLWVREHTPERSVFLTWSSIHAPVSMIGGRLRVLGYVNWAYGHGFDFWERNQDIERAYRGSITETLEVAEIYEVSYIYVGEEELKNAPGCLKKFEGTPELEKVYQDPSGGNHIFKIKGTTSNLR
jgi:hypothetical protein